MERVMKWTGRMVFLVVCFAALLIWFTPEKAEAAEEYKKIEYDQIVKAGNYYFKYEGSEVLFSTSQYGYYKKAAFGGYVGTPYTNGVYIIAVGNTQGSYMPLLRCNVAANTVKTLKKLNRGTWSYEAPYWDVSAIYGKKIYLTKGSQEAWNYKTYCCSLSGKKLKKILNNCKIEGRSGKYVIARNEYQTDVSAHRWTIYKIKSSGKLKKVKSLGKYIGSAEIIGKKIYYSKFTEKTMKNMKVCRCTLNGKKVKKLGAFHTSKDFGMCLASGFTSSTCNVYIDGVNYTYTYSTKQLTAK